MTHGLAAFGMYRSTKALHVGAEALRAAKFRHTDISVMYSDGQRGLQWRETVPCDDDGVADDHEDDDPTARAVLLTTLSGLGALAMSDGPFMAGGPILATVTGGDTLLSSLLRLGIPEHDLASFEERLRAGALLLSVQCDDDAWAAQAREILERTGAERVVATA